MTAVYALVLRRTRFSLSAWAVACAAALTLALTMPSWIFTLRDHNAVIRVLAGAGGGIVLLALLVNQTAHYIADASRDRAGYRRSEMRARLRRKPAVTYIRPLEQKVAPVAYVLDAAGAGDETPVPVEERTVVAGVAPEASADAPMHDTDAAAPHKPPKPEETGAKGLDVAAAAMVATEPAPVESGVAAQEINETVESQPDPEPAPAYNPAMAYVLAERAFALKAAARWGESATAFMAACALCGDWQERKLLALEQLGVLMRANLYEDAAAKVFDILAGMPGLGDEEKDRLRGVLIELEGVNI